MTTELSAGSFRSGSLPRLPAPGQKHIRDPPFCIVSSRRVSTRPLDLKCARFEKSLYDLIRGLRNHKGNEKEYIQKSLKECRAEVRSQDMDVKATALLKLVYLEMVGYDMSWASFHVLEVMSSPKYHQKRVGYLGAVQSFRPDTEVLMLATNLLKKDLASSTPTVISLPIATLPHVITPSLALSTLADLLPRLGHSQSNIRKKTLVTLYRLALVYPEALRAAWPKIKERLMDPNEDPSVTAAIVNVVCELGWRRPHDFLPLAPRLFELLVEGGNNWMAIKLIKLFATLTPLEPRLVRKLLPPLTNIIATTPAMSLLYECINGIIQGGILGSTDEPTDTDEIATLCVNKLRGMVMVDGDPNLKYVALLAFNKIVVTHPHLVAQQEDVILECIDSSDITIRIQALELVQGMVSADNLVPVVSRLMKQLKSSAPGRDHERAGGTVSLEPSSESDDELSPAAMAESDKNAPPPLPEDYRLDVVRRILFMCSKDNYANILDFDWYIDVLTQLVRTAPVPRQLDSMGDASSVGSSRSWPSSSSDVAERVGDELRNVAVKVRAMRSTAVRAGYNIVVQLNADTPSSHKVTSGALKSVTWILGEYAVLLQDPDGTLNSILQLATRAARPEVCTTSLLAIAKIFASIAGDATQPWTPERKTRISLLMARILHVAEPLALHPNLEVQERAVELVELLRLTAEAASGQPASTDEAPQDPPLLLTQAIPSLFTGWELNSVAPGAQRNVPLPDGLDLDEAIHPNLNHLLSAADLATIEPEEPDEFQVYYNQRPAPTAISSSAPAVGRLAGPAGQEEMMVGSYQQQQQQLSEESYLDADIIARRKAERMERNRDDPFYIPSSSSANNNDVPARTSTPIHNILQSSNGPDLDIDSIPIMKLELDNLAGPAISTSPKRQAKPKHRIVIASDETLEGGDGGGNDNGTRPYDSENMSDNHARARSRKAKQSILQVDSSHIGSFSLEGAGTSASGYGFDYEQQQREEAEMQQAIKEVERLRLEMQRANERIQIAQGVDAAGTVVKKKKKMKATTTKNTNDTNNDNKKRVKKAKKAANEATDSADAQEEAAKPRQKKSKKVVATPEGGGSTFLEETPIMADASLAAGGPPSGSAMTDDVVVLPKKSTKKKKTAVKAKRLAEIED
ncbi:hypothetical protein E4U42_005983 [Claviceps africana]|uniref:AP-3 complex subunit delta n=1 Tax=Claviceps africana TaxID=83212 RepID=A0A8K0NNV7_9HYPO|nr:hypothetical protein E4U42_005983 [Claviceps africana]